MGHRAHVATRGARLDLYIDCLALVRPMQIDPSEPRRAPARPRRARATVAVAYDRVSSIAAPVFVRDDAIAALAVTVPEVTEEAVKSVLRRASQLTLALIQ